MSMTALSPAPATGHVENVSLRDLVVVAAARFPLLISIAAVIFVLGAIFVLTRADLYRAETIIIVEPQTSGLLSNDVMAFGRIETEMMMRNQVEILRSRPVLERVANELSLVPENGDMDATIQRLQDWTRIRFQEGSGVITLIARTPDATLSADLANTLAKAYLDEQADYRQSLEQNTTQSLTERVARLAQDVRKAEEELTAFQVANELTDVSGNQSLAGLQLADLNRELINARGALTEAEAKANQATSMRRSSASLEALSEVLASPLISQLRQRQTDLSTEAAQLRERLGPNHPDVIKMAAEQRELQISINDQVGRFITQLQNEADVAASRVATLEEQVATIQDTFEAQSEKRIQLRELERSAETAQEIYLATLSRLGQSSPDSDGLAPDARILSAAVPADEPATAPKFLLFLALIPAGLVAGYVASLGLEILTGSGFRSDMSVTRQLGVPVLGTIPSLKLLHNKHHLAASIMSEQIISDPRSTHSAAIREVAALLKRPTEGNRHVVVMTSTLSGEGTVPLGLSYARALAKDGHKTLLIDADVFSPSLPPMLSMNDDGKSLGDYLDEKVFAKEIIKEDPSSPLHIIANQRDVMIDPATAAEGMAKLVEELAGEFDHVLVTVPPLLSGRRSTAIYRQADDILLVIRWERTPRDAVQSAVHHLGEHRSKLNGAVLFDVHSRRHDVYTHGLLTHGLMPQQRRPHQA